MDDTLTTVTVATDPYGAARRDYRIPVELLNLATIRHPHHDGEWFYGEDPISGTHGVLGFAAPDSDGVTAYVNARLTRDQIPQLIAFLAAVYVKSGDA